MTKLLDSYLGPYHLTALLNEGGLSDIYKASLPDGNIVALKVLRPSKDTHASRKQFLWAAQTMNMLQHPHIVKVIDYGVYGSYAVCAMPLYEYGCLADLLHHGPLPLHRAFNLLNQLAKALSYIHSKGLAHFDLKPDNCLLKNAAHSEVLLTDFDLARLWRSGHIPYRQRITGTPAYMAPEQWRDERGDQRVDVYALGIIAFELFTGQVPFDPATTDLEALMYKHLRKSPPALLDLNPQLPPALTEVVHRALAKAPADRYRTIRQFMQALHQCLVTYDANLSNDNDIPLTVLTEPETSPPPIMASTAMSVSPRPTAPIVLALLLGVALLVAGILAVILWMLIQR